MKAELAAEMSARRVVYAAKGVAELQPCVVRTDGLGPMEVVVRTHRTLISPGTELANLHDRRAPHNVPRVFPVERVGYANVGTVLAAGEQSGVQPGQRIYSMGPHASIARVDATTDLCVPVPDGLEDEKAVFARLVTVSMTTLRTTEARAGDEVAVIGLGIVGNLAAQVFQIAGMTVRAFDLSPVRVGLAQRCGVADALQPDARKPFLARHRLVMEASGSARALVSAVELAADFGEVVMIGAPWGGEENSVPSSALLRDVFFRFLKLRSGSEWEIPRRPFRWARSSIYHNSEVALEWLRSGRLRVEPLITHRLSPSRIQEAYDGLVRAPDEFLGVVLDWDGTVGARGSFTPPE